jgi:hypothetical protein
MLRTLLTLNNASANVRLNVMVFWALYGGFRQALGGIHFDLDHDAIQPDHCAGKHPS